MPITNRDKITINKNILEMLKLRLVDKPSGQLPAQGKYYFEKRPYELATIGSLAPEPTLEDLQGQFAPAPNSMGLVFLVVPDKDNRVRLEVNGHFDLAHAYIPDYDDMVANLIIVNDSPRAKQDVPEAFVRYGLTFENLVFEFEVEDSPNVVLPDEDTLAASLADHFARVAHDDRVYRALKKVDDPPTWGHTIAWSHTIVDQSSLTEHVRSAFFDPESPPLPYRVSMECRYRRAPSLGDERVSNAILVELHLVNHTTETDARAYRLFRHRLMDVGFRARIRKGHHAPMLFSLAPRDYRYRDSQLIGGYGQACALVSPERNVVATESMPRFDQPWIETPDAEQAGMKHAPSFEALSKSPIPILRDLASAMKNYLFEWNTHVKALERANDPSATHARTDYGDFSAEIDRFQSGIDLLVRDDVLLRSFCLMNEVMRRATQKQGKTFTSWRLFQLAYIVSQLDSIYERFVEARTESAASNEVADVLWFATGGGKTEAYIGLITIAMFYQRMRERAYGVTAWLRFPLRMLSVQQFQRLAYVLGQANEIKLEQNVPGHPFTVGYFTGRGTPGRISSTADYAKSYYLPNISNSKEHMQQLRFINRCPHCGERVHVRFVTRNFRIQHYCKNDGCWSNSTSRPGDYGEGIRGELGIFVSDEECYRYLPTILVGTLDKLAVLGHNPNFEKFFGRSTHYCPDHGFITQGRCKGPLYDDGEQRTCANNSTTSATKTVAAPRLRDPGFSFLITDELHLLGESLGNFDAHYETLLADIQRQSGGIFPKYLGATATIREYQNHISHLYLRKSRKFPVAGRTRDETFYSRVRVEDGEALTRRLYVGLLPISSGPAAVTNVVADANQRYQRLLAYLLEMADQSPVVFANQLGVDPDKTAAAKAHLATNLQPMLIYSIRNADADLIMKRFDDDNAARLHDGQHLLISERLDGHTDLAKIQDVIERIEVNAPDDPVHQVVATSVVSHGVDIERLNIEYFTGWPKSTSEYLQSSSRSGRTHPGLILAALSYSKLYEYSIYSRFSEYHRFMDRLIEAVPINRFAPNVLSRTLPGIFNALLFNWARHQSWGGSINPFESETVRQALISDDANGRAIVDRMVSALALERARSLEYFSDRMIDDFELDLRERSQRMVQIFRNLPPRFSKDSVSEVLRRQYQFGPLQSFRDIEKQVLIKADDDHGRRVLAAVSR